MIKVADSYLWKMSPLFFIFPGNSKTTCFLKMRSKRKFLKIRIYLYLNWLEIDAAENTEVSHVLDIDFVNSVSANYFDRIYINIKTRRERLKSALYLRLKKRKRLFLRKKLEIFEFFSFRNRRIVPKNVKGGTLWALLTYILLQNMKKLEGGTLLRH